LRIRRADRSNFIITKYFLHLVSCKKRFSLDCQLRKIKWFYNPIAAMCLQRLTCRYGFTYRTDCERHCIDPRKRESEEPAKSLAELQRILDQLNGKYKQKTKPPRPPRATRSTRSTRPTRPTTKKTKPSPTVSRTVTTPVPVASENPEELTIKDPLEVLDPSNLNLPSVVTQKATKKTTQYKKMVPYTTTTTTREKGILEKVIEKPKQIYEQLNKWGSH